MTLEVIIGFAVYAVVCLYLFSRTVDIETGRVKSDTNEHNIQGNTSQISDHTRRIEALESFQEEVRQKTMADDARDARDA